MSWGLIAGGAIAGGLTYLGTKKATEATEKAAEKQASAITKGAETSAEYQQQALDYLKASQAAPQATRDLALQQLQGMFGLNVPQQQAAYDRFMQSRADREARKGGLGGFLGGIFGGDKVQPDLPPRPEDPGVIGGDIPLPEYQAPGAGLPEYQAPGAGLPEYQAPDMGIPEFQQPEMGIPEYQAPGTARPEFGYQGATEAELVQRAQESPLYAAMMGGQDAAQEAVMRQAAATGGLRGGNVQGALAQQASDIQRDALLRSYGEQRALEEQGYGRAAEQYARELQGYGLDVGEAERAFGRDLQRYGLGQQAAESAFGRDLQRYGLGRDEASQAYQRGLTEYGLGRDEASQAYQRALTEYGLGAAEAESDYARQLQQYQMQQALQSQQLQGLMGLAGIPTGAGQIAGLMGGIGQTLGQGQAGAGSALSQGALAAAQMQQQALGGLLNLGGTLGGAYLSRPQPSDKRFKANIEKTGTVNGIELFTWDWNNLAEQKYGLTGRGYGPIAQKLEATHPDMVSLDEDGYLLVDQEKLLKKLKAA